MKDGTVLETCIHRWHVVHFFQGGSILGKRIWGSAKFMCDKCGTTKWVDEKPHED